MTQNENQSEFSAPNSDDEGHAFEETTTQELLEQAQANAQAAIIGTIRFLEARGVPLEEWTASLGETFGRGWDEPEPWAADEFLDAMLTNLRAFGAAVITADLEPDRAAAEITGFPDPDLCELFEVEPATVARFNDAARVLATARGLTWEWRLEGDRIHYLTTRRPHPAPSAPPSPNPGGGFGAPPRPASGERPGG